MQGYNCIIIYNAKADKALFCKRLSDPYEGKYNLVGGKINPGEEGFAAAYRELFEETGIGESDVILTHMMDFRYYNQDCYVEVYVGQLTEEVGLVEEKHPLCWLPLTEDFFDQERFAGEGNIGHMFEQVKQFGPGFASVGEPYTILCYGDSNTYGYNPLTQKRHGVNERWPLILQKLLGDGYRVIEEGCNGRTAYNMVEDNPWKTGDYGMKAILNSHKPVDLLIFMLGSNDLKTLYDSSPGDIADAMAVMLKEAAQFMLDQQEFVPEFLLISPPEIDGRIGDTFFGDEFDLSSAERSRQLASVLAETAARFSFEGKGCHFLNAADYVKPSVHDCLHLEPDQHGLLAEAVCDKILKDIKTSGLL